MEFLLGLLHLSITYVSTNQEPFWLLGQGLHQYINIFVFEKYKNVSVHVHVGLYIIKLFHFVWI